MDRKKKDSNAESKPKASKRDPGAPAENSLKSARNDLIVVGLGASAGGIKAVQEFFGTMPPNSGMAFVVILHLSPEHESNLASILQARTTMPVTIVEQTHRVEPNHVYVIPPNRQLEMIDGVIRSSGLSGEHGERVAIDIFFRTLAEAYERNAVCIVLSGSGTDGTLGLKAVKEANGFAIVQTPADAEHDSMPRSAIQTQLVDWVLPVREMPEKLIRFRDSSRRLHLTGGDSDGQVAREIQADESLREILAVLRVRTGHDFSNYKTPTLVRRIARHLQIHELPDIPSYLEFLREKPEEIHSLLKNLLINVTNFFRDKDAWEALERDTIPQIFAGKKVSDTVRVWSCGCASGEEAYSLAILFSEYAEKMHDPPKIQVFATDVDDEAINEAREHRYPQSIEADVSPARLKRFFLKEGRYYRIKKELREMVLFAPHNVLRDPPFSKLDLIACRNLLIYLNRYTQERVMEIFHFALNPQGFLFLGSSETAEAVPQLFSPIEKKLRIYARRPASLIPPTAPLMPVVGRWEIKVPEIRSLKKGDRQFSLSEVHYKLLETFAPPSALVSRDFEIQYLSESAGRFLRFRGGEPSNNILKLVHPDLLPDLRAALFTAQREKKTAEFPNVRALIEGKQTNVKIIVTAVEVEEETSDYLLILFDEENRIILPHGELAKTAAARRAPKDDAMEAVVLRLEEELTRTKDNLRTTIEQHEISVEELKASNEELQAINEELRSTTEKLETSKEEAQSVNEELTTVNHELKEKIEETARTNSDLNNLMASTDIATIFLDREFRIKRFTPPVEQIFNITHTDIGRPLEHFTHRLEYKNLARDASEVLRKLTPIEREVQDNQNVTYLARFLPYRTTDDRIEGVILNFIDITERKSAEDALRDSEEKYRLLFTSIDEGFAVAELLLDQNGQTSGIRVLETNPSFERMAAGKNAAELSPEQILGDAESPWFASYLRVVETGESLRSEIYLAPLASWFELNISRIGDRGSRRFAVVFNDITPRKQDEERLRSSEMRQSFLVRLGDAIRPQLDPLAIEAAAAELLGTQLGVDHARYFAATGDSVSVYGKPSVEGLRRGETQICRDTKNDPNLSEAEKRALDAAGIGAFIVVPLLKNGAIESVLALHSLAPRSWTEIEGELAREVAERTRAAVERARAETALRASEERFRAVANLVPDLLWHSEPDGSTDWVYDRWTEFTGQTFEQAIGWGWTEAIHPDDRQESFKRYFEAVEAGKPLHQEHRIRRFDGEYRWVVVNALPLVDESGKLIKMYGAATNIHELRLAHEALRVSEEQYRTLFDSIDEGFCTIEVLFDKRGTAVDYRFLETNPAFARQTGLSEANGKTARELLPGLEPFWFETFGRIARTGEALRFEHQVAELDKFFDVYAFRLGAPSENRVAVIFSDIIDRKRTEAALRESEERMRIAIEASRLATWEWNLVTDEILWNERHFTLLGMRPRRKPVTLETFFRRVHPDDRQRLNRTLRQAIKNRSVFESEFAIIRTDGVTRWMNGYGQITELSSDGKPLKMSGFMFEITERKQAEESLRKSEEQLRLILESTKDYAIITFDLKGRITRWNAGAEKIFGYTQKEAVGQSTKLIFTPEDIKNGVPEMELISSLKNGRAEDERWHIRKDGTRFFASGVMQLLKDGSTEGFVKICRDQTARLENEQLALEKHMLRRLVTAQEDERRRIARDIHDHFGQQLTALRLMLDAIRKTGSGDPQISAQADEAQKAAAALDANVDFIAWELRPAALDDLGLRSALANFVSEWSKHTGIKTEFHTSGLSRARLDHETETNLYRIAQEALNNVQKHARAKNVSVLLEKSRQKVSLIIEDDGIGFNPADKANRLKGIGLIGMIERARICGGELEIESARGKGTTVFARIPVTKE